MANCITQYGSWRYKTKRGRLVKSLSYLDNYNTSHWNGRYYESKLLINGHYTFYSSSIKFYYLDGRYSGMRLKELHYKKT
jgi:hypothetical protein